MDKLKDLKKQDELDEVDELQNLKELEELEQMEGLEQLEELEQLEGIEGLDKIRALREQKQQRLQKKPKLLKDLKEFLLVTISIILMVIGIYFFKFPNHFSFGGVTGIAVLLSKYNIASPSYIVLVINAILLIIGFLFLGKKFGIKTAYASILLSLMLSILEKICPLSKPLTDEPMLELLFAVLLPAVGSAILFNIGASGGGTDIIAMIMRKYTNLNIGRALFITDLIITLAAWLVFDIKTGLFSLTGLMIKSLIIDNVIESFNLCKYFNIVCEDPNPICDYIVNVLNRSATIYAAKGAFTHKNKYIILTAMRRHQALKLQQFVKQTDGKAFVLISNTSEIIGKGFRA